MARIYPFRALRYNPSRVRIEDVVTQPYDKITPSMQQAYYRRSPYNLVRIILGLPELFDADADENGDGAAGVYTRAARDFNEWRAQGVLSRESDPCIFAYSQRFVAPGSSGASFERRGFIALGELADYQQGVVFPHEQTHTRTKSDRLNLLRATRAHFGQIFMLYSDPAQTAERLLFAGISSPDIEVTDEYGVYHRVSRITDPNTINMLAAAMKDKKLIIADGHHRYETALQYSREQTPTASAPVERNAAALPQPARPESAAMMTFVNMDSEGLVILPTHRVVFDLENFSPADFLERAEQYFEIEDLQAAEVETITRCLSTQRPETTAFAAITRQGRYLLTAKPTAIATALQAVHDRCRRLDVVRLHSVVLERILGMTPEDLREQRHLRFTREAAEAAEQVSEGRADLAFLMNPVTLDQLREVAFGGDVMPQKSTDFYPKLLSGLAIYALD